MITSKNIKKILIVKPSSLGDIIHSLPFLNIIRKNFPDARIDWIVAKGLDFLLENHPMIDRVWIIEKEKWKEISNAKNTVKDVLAFCRDLRKQNFDLVLDLSGLLRSGLISFFSKAKIL